MGSFYMKAVGVSFGNRQRVISRLHTGDILQFVLEPNNPYDRYAVQIVTLDGQQVGYVSRDYNQNIFERIQAGQRYRLTVSTITGGGFDSQYGVNILVEY